MEKNPVILQISDTQFGDRFGFIDYSSACDSVIMDIECFDNEKIPKPNLIIHCGDIADTGGIDQYRSGKEFLNRLCKKTKISHQYCIIVPGNHDLDIEDANELYFKNYEEFFKHFYEGCSNIQYSEETVTYDFSDEFSLVIVTWNSSYTCTKDDMRNPEIKIKQLNNALKSLDGYEKGITKLFVCHHSLLSTDRYGQIGNTILVVDSLCKYNVDIYMHGHIHNGSTRTLSSTNMKSNIFSIGAGSLSVSQKERPGEEKLGSVPNQYSIVSLNTEKKIATVYYRQYIPYPPPGKWTKYCAHDDNKDYLDFDYKDHKIVDSVYTDKVNKLTTTIDRARLQLCKPRPFSATSSIAYEGDNYGPRVLIISPHPDDIMQSCTATILKLRERTKATIWIYHVAPIRSSPEANVNRCIEAALSTKFLLRDVKKDEFEEQINTGLNLRHDSEIKKFCSEIINDISNSSIFSGTNTLPQQLILGAYGLGASEIKDGYIRKSIDKLEEELFRLKQSICPQIVIAPFPYDPHPDHATVGELTAWIFRTQESVWHYEIPKMEGSAIRVFNPNLFINVSEEVLSNGGLKDYQTYSNAKLFLFEKIFKEKDGSKHWFDMGLYKGHMRIRAAQAFFPKTQDDHMPFVEAFEAKLFVDSIT